MLLRLQRLLAAAMRLETALAAIARAMAFVSAGAVAVIMALLVVSSLRRYVFDTPIPETEELGSLLFLAVSLLSIPYGFFRGRHVRIEILSRYLPTRLRLGLEAAGLVLGVLALLVLVRETWSLTAFSFQIGARSDMSEINLWPWRLLLPVALGLFTAAIGLRAAVIVLRLLSNQVADPVPDEAELPLH